MFSLIKGFLFLFLLKKKLFSPIPTQILEDNKKIEKKGIYTIICIKHEIENENIFSNQIGLFINEKGEEKRKHIILPN